MPKLGKGLEIVKLLHSKVSKPMHKPLVSMVFPSLGAHIDGCELCILREFGWGHVAL